MRRKFRSLVTSFLAIVLMLTLMPMQALANDTLDTFSNIPINKTDHNTGQSVETGKASIKFDTMKYSSFNSEQQNEYQIVMEGGATKEDLGPGGNLSLTIDDGYERVELYMVYITGVVSNTFVNGAVNNKAIMTVPVPEGYTGIGAKRIFNWAKSGDAQEDYEKVNVTVNTDGTVSFPIVMGFVDWNLDGTNFSVNGSYAVEYQKIIDISTLTSKASLSGQSFEATGSAIEPVVTIQGLTKDTDFKVSYANNIQPGTATVTITGMGKYTGTLTLNFTITSPAPQNGQVVKDETSKAEYKITSTEGGAVEVEYTASEAKDAKTVTIPATVDVNGQAAKVTSVANNAFKGNKTITSVTVGSNVEKVGTGAFQNCTKLKTVTIGKNVKTISKNAFNGCKSLKTIKIQSTSITKMQKNSLKGISKNATIKVPKKKLEAYTKLIRKSGAPAGVKVKK